MGEGTAEPWRMERGLVQCGMRNVAACGGTRVGTVERLGKATSLSLSGGLTRGALRHNAKRQRRRFSQPSSHAPVVFFSCPLEKVKNGLT